MINEGLNKGIPVEEQRKDPVAWQMELLKKDFELFDELSSRRDVVFTDTSFIETVVFGARAGIEIGQGVKEWVQNKRYKSVYFLSQIEDYKSSEVRMETRQVADQICEEVKAAYSLYGYNVVMVPSMSIEQRVSTILEHMKICMKI